MKMFMLVCTVKRYSVITASLPAAGSVPRNRYGPFHLLQKYQKFHSCWRCKASASSGKITRSSTPVDTVLPVKRMIFYRTVKQGGDQFFYS